MKLYLAGGAVRDMLLGRPPSDRDFSFQGQAHEFLERFPKAQAVGGSFPVYWLEGREYSPLRGEDPDADLQARDLSINALLLELPGAGSTTPPLLHMHPLALQDLQDRVLRPASERSMTDDPLRVFRAARFAAQLPDFSLHPELERGMRKVAEQGLLAGLPAERVGNELRKGLAAPAPERFIRILDRCGCLSPWFEELRTARDIPAGPAKYHDASVLEHTLDVVSRLSGDPLLAWMGLVHDLGKCATPRHLLPRHHGHEERGADLALGLGRRLKLPAEYIRAGELGSRHHMTCARYAELRPGTRVDLLTRLSAHGLVERLFDLSFADRSSGPRGLDATHHGPEALQDLERIRSVHLPEEWRNLGEESGRRLRQLRCDALLLTASR